MKTQNTAYEYAKNIFYDRYGAVLSEKIGEYFDLLENKYSNYEVKEAIDFITTMKTDKTSALMCLEAVLKRRIAVEQISFKEER